MGIFLSKLDVPAQKIKKFITRGKRYKKEGTSYNDIREDLNSLDLVFFRGGHASDLIRLIEKLDAESDNRFGSKFSHIPSDEFSHIGLIVKSDILDFERCGLPISAEGITDSFHESPEGIYIFESTMSGYLTDGVYNVEGRPFLGMQLRDFDKVVKGYDAKKNTRIAIAHLDDDVRSSLDMDKIKEQFTELFLKYNGIGYDYNPISLLSSIINFIRPVRGIIEKLLCTEDWLFCSEAVATIYKELNILPESTEPKNVVPMDFLGYDDESADEGGVIRIIDEIEYIIYSKS
jgi:hypothetical protein